MDGVEEKERGRVAFMEGDVPVHPLAAVFPMLSDDELADLADDIEANGLIHPIMLDQAGDLLVDGRNRLAACAIAGVEPHFERLPEGVEPADYIVSANLQRRNLTKGQAAMALAMIYPEPKRGMHSEFRSGTGDVSKARLSLARTVFRMAPDDLAPAVLWGTRSLDSAYAEVRGREQSAMSEEAQLARLRAEAPDVADLVVEGTLTLAAGRAELDERSRVKRITIEQGQRALAEIVPTFVAHVAAMVAVGELGTFISLDKDQKAQLRDAVAILKKRGIG